MTTYVVNEPTKGESLMKSSVLTVAGHDHNLDKVKIIGESGPVISVTEDQLNTDNDCVKISTMGEFSNDGCIIFLKQEGKYVILLGTKTANDIILSPKYNGTLSGRLISHIALKKARIS